MLPVQEQSTDWIRQRHSAAQRLHGVHKDPTHEALQKLPVIILNFHHFNSQLTHTTLKNGELLKHFKISKTVPTCFGLQGNHHQGATAST
jgi:hypothetical protein